MPRNKTEAEWEAEHDLDTLISAEEIKKSKTRMDKAVKIAKKKAEEAKKVAQKMKPKAKAKPKGKATKKKK